MYEPPDSGAGNDATGDRGYAYGEEGHFENVTTQTTKNQEDIFVVDGSNGGIFVDSVSDQEPWEQWGQIADADFGDGFTVPVQPIAAVKRDEHQLDIFVTGRDGAIYTNWVIDHGSWNEWIRLDDSNFPDLFRVPPGSPVTAVKRDDHQEDIFVVGNDGAIWTNWVVDADPWNQWIRIADSSFPDGFTVSMQPIAAIKRDEHQEDIFVTGRDGAIYTNWVVDHGPWNEWLRVGELHVAPGSPVTAVKRDEHQLDIFVTGRDGAIYTNWVVDHGSWNEWIRIADANFGDGFTIPVQPIAAVKRDEHLEDIFVTGRDGAIYTNWVLDHGPWNEWTQIDDASFPDSFRVPPGSPVTAVKRDDHQEDIFVVGNDGRIYTNWVMDYDPWNRWIALS